MPEQYEEWCVCVNEWKNPSREGVPRARERVVLRVKGRNAYQAAIRWAKKKGLGASTTTIDAPPFNTNGGRLEVVGWELAPIWDLQDY